MATNVRLIRTWFFVLVVAGVSSVTYALQQFVWYRELSVVSSSAFETSSALLLPMNVFSEFQFLLSFGIIFLAFDFLSRDKRARIDEVISSLPVTNIQLVFGRAIGITTLFYLIVAGFICSYYLIGAFCEFVLPTTGFHRPELISTTATLLFDVFPYLLFWTSTVMLVTVIVRFRVLAATISVGLMLLFFWLQDNVPMFSHFFWGLSVLSSQLPSDIAPTIPSGLLIAQRVLLVLFAVVILLIVAQRYPRLDERKRTSYLVLGIVLVTLWYGGSAFVSVQISNPTDERRAFYAAHNAYTNSPVIDVIAMSGTVDIDPAKSIGLDLNLELKLHDEVDQLAFSLNPGYEVEHIRLNNEPVAYTFENGLLLLQRAVLKTDVVPLRLNVRAAGNLNTNFANLESSSDSFRTPDETETQIVAYGTHSAINHKNYVALMPAVAWYPLPGSHTHRNLTQNRPRDYFITDLDINAPADWYVGGPGKGRAELNTESSVFTFAPRSPIHQVALFASKFERRAMEANGIEFELLVSPDSMTNVDLFAPIVQELRNEISELTRRAEKLGLSYPFDAFSVIEVPNYLATFDKSVHMPSTRSQPGVFLLREGKFLAVPFVDQIQSIAGDPNFTEKEKRDKQLSYLLNYFNNDVTGGNVIAAATNNLFLGQTYPTSYQAEALSFLFNYLVLKVLAVDGGFHSAYILIDKGYADSAWSAAQNVLRGTSTFTASGLLHNAYVNRPEVWETLLRERQVSASQNSWNEGVHHHAQILLAEQISELLLERFGADRVTQVLVAIRDRFEARSFTYSDVVAIGEALEVPLDDTMAIWLNGVKPAGYRTSSFKTVRLPDEPDGTPVYESALFVENSESNVGFFRIEYATEQQKTSSGHKLIPTAVATLAGKSSIEIAIRSSDPIEAVQLKPYLSLNRTSFEIPNENQREIYNERRQPKPFITPTEWAYDEGNSIIIDDLDAGFSVDSTTDDRPFFKVSRLSITPIARSSNGLDAGLESAGGFTYLSQGNWMRQQADSAYGRYRKTFVRAESFDSTPTAHIRTNIPKAGAWKLDYHLPNIESPSGQRISGFGPHLIFLSQGGEWTDFDLQLRVGDGVRAIEFDGRTMQAGWNDLGTYELPSQEVTLSISSNTDFGTTVIDAIRWTPVIPRNNTQ